jgi:hypothetical protein
MIRSCLNFLATAGRAALLLAPKVVIVPILLLLPHASVQAAAAAAGVAPLSFSAIADIDLPGRYKWIDAKGESYIVLYPDHTFMNKDGTRFGTYRWELTADSLVMTWSRSFSRLTRLDAPGSYSADDKGTTVRMQKQPPPPPQLAAEPPALTNGVIASLSLGLSVETQGLTPVNLRGDGAIFPATVNGVACYEMVRKDNRPTAYLYLQIDPKLKQAPITNAFVIVEYFDPLPSNGQNGLLVVHFDGTGGAYDTTQALNLSGSQSWKAAIFYVATPGFTARQNAGADFRLATRSPQMFVRSVKLVTNRIPTEKYKFPLLVSDKRSP